MEGLYSTEQDKTRKEIAGASGKFAQTYLKARKAGFAHTKRGRSPDGPFAELLIMIGKRKPTDWWDVGDTPGEIKRGG